MDGFIFFTLHDPDSHNPIPPKIDPLPTPVNQTSITVEGNAYSGFNVEVYRNNELMGTVNADERGRFRLEGVPLVPGSNAIRVRQKEGMADLGGKNLTLTAADSSETIVELITGIPSRPDVKIDFPVDGAVTNTDLLPLRGTTNDPNAVLRLNGYYNSSGYAQNQGGRFVSNQLIPLLPGKNTLWIEATAPDGSRGVDKITVYSKKDAIVPSVQVTSPGKDQEVYDRYIPVTGNSDSSVQRVIVNESEAIMDSGAFQSSMDIFNRYVRNPYGYERMLTAWAMDANGRIGHHDVPLQYKYVPTPQVYINSHFDGELLSDSPITVSGEITNASGVTINGVQAMIDGNTFKAVIELKEGQNAMTVIARNSVKAGAQTINVIYNPDVPITLQSLTIAPATAYVQSGDTLQLKLTGAYSNGKTVDLTSHAQWTSSDESISRVYKGLVQNYDKGVTTITAAIGGLIASRDVKTGPPGLKSIRVGYESELGTGYMTDSPEIKTGETLKFKVYGVYSDGALYYINGCGLTWTSSNTNVATIVATINANGLATGISKGTTEISTVCQGVTGSTTLTVTQAPIYLFITTPTDGSTINAKTTTVTGKIFSATSDTVITVNGVQTTITGDTFTADNVQLIEGINNITATATSNSGQTASQSVTVTVPPAITLKISSPTDGSSITGTRATVKGTISNWTGNETGITVNGIPAQIYNGRFTANVPLTEGPNTITVTATDTAGNTAQAQTTVSATTPANYVKLTSNIESGTGPMEVTFTVDSSIELTATNSYIAYTGPTQIELLTATPTEYKARINTEGIYDFIVQATDSSGNVYRDSITVTVLNKTALDNLLKAKWEGMKRALVAGDVGSALNYYLESSKEKYQTIYTILKDYLPSIVAEMNDIEMVYVNDGTAKYRIRKMEEDGEMAYYVYFVMDSDGLWKIYDY